MCQLSLAFEMNLESYYVRLILDERIRVAYSNSLLCSVARNSLITSVHTLIALPNITCDFACAVTIPSNTIVTTACK